MLLRYERSSGQQINFDKLTVFFSSNTGEARREEIKSLYGIQATTDLGKYLGLPSMVSRERKRAFRKLKYRINARVNA